jgi:RNA polymerase-binding transcription factor
MAKHPSLCLDYLTYDLFSQTKFLMGHADDMNDAGKTAISARIHARLAEIDAENRLGQAALAVVELDQQSVGRLSRMDALQNQAMARAQQSRRDGEAKRLRDALRRIDDAGFGYCADCGGKIATRRLELNPTAVKCISCAAG